MFWSRTSIYFWLLADPEGFYQILRLLPYHADTLLQLSEVYFQREGMLSNKVDVRLLNKTPPEHSTAADFIDRALFTYERAFVGSLNFTSGLSRMDFDRVENRPFFLAVHRQITYVTFIAACTRQNDKMIEVSVQ